MQISYDLSDIEAIADKIVTTVRSNVLLFYGEMGAGKTTLIKAIVKKLGVTDTISSPTFSIVNEYVTGNEQLIYHFDFYRITNQEEALDMGFEEYIFNGDWIFIEWPDNISKFLPNEADIIKIEKQNTNKRVISIN
ncbi:tRNA (adenosine(37)-N6)-threonylcarbamoyltransferase complex ATPase subunit type 1 TsaE [Dokdonia donghaensis]|uniref:tRNA threonylcarbamoyladenosine biosynthesis protein TsaE n=1 Tax=Dokdonia donghaensis DSW-1 TaxID=1300343 RepID=A0A0A2GTS7_9FLAO|nr:tRNA (adenosine(37)-N6)-threonylcarbamoyltransferase complex ATPase subunit type 1 TsaE [Dokdonia donghaensis]ANH60872.1 tRNA threonylcarbamoyladenosine biosynthesis protein TsaE [Dokdonia donghaensis DSW-1]KGO05878.1 hydrolase [Dokdonia donghaensis DSW-1]